MTEIIKKEYSPNFEGHQIATAFFFQFSRFEYAMKMMGFVKEGLRDAQADWDKLFKQEEICKLLEDPQPTELKKAIEYYLALPNERSGRPLKQTMNNGKLDFTDVTVNGHKAHKLSVYIRRTRNNLFHGGKFPTSGELRLSNPKKDIPLMENGLVILNACLNALPKLREMYITDD